MTEREAIEAHPLFDRWIAEDALPGCWIDKFNGAHFSIPMIHEAHGIPNTPHEIAETRAMMKSMLEIVVPDSIVLDGPP